MTSSEADFYDKEKSVEAYRELVTELPFIRTVERPTLKAIFGNLSGKSVLEIGCGEARICEQLVQWGASKVVGCDLSPTMIEQCRKRNIPNSEFFVCDGREVTQDAKFDMVVSVMVMQHMDSYESLLSYAKSAFDAAKPGGVFCGNVIIYDRDHPLNGYHEAIGEKYEIESDEEFCKVQEIFDDYQIHIVCYRIFSSTVVKALKEAGFSEVEWRPLVVNEEGKKLYTDEQIRNDMRTVWPFTAKKN